MQILERSKSSKIEDRAKVHVEPLCALPSENSSTTRKFVNGLSSKRLIVGVDRGPMLQGGQARSARQELLNSHSNQLWSQNRTVACSNWCYRLK